MISMASKFKSNISGGYIIAECSTIRKRIHNSEPGGNVSEESSHKSEVVLFSSSALRGGGGGVSSIEELKVGAMVLVWKPLCMTSGDRFEEGSPSLICTRFVVVT